MLLVAVTVIFVHMNLIWLWYRHTKNPSVVDVGWASGLTITGMLYLYTSPISMKKIILSLVLLIWGLRLGGYLWYTRIHPNLLDKRYAQLSEKWKMPKPLGFLLNFQCQGLLIGMVSLPWYFAAQLSPENPISAIDYLLILIALFAIATESLADVQLQRFKTRHVGKVCDVGVWFYSRHPNYFFEWLTWCSFASFAFSAPLGWLAWVSPLVLWLIMTRITAPLTERGSIASRGELYLRYQKSTPTFFPKLLNPFRR